MTRKTFDWNTELAAMRSARENAEPPKPLTAEQRAAQLKAQRDARVNSVMRTGFSQRNRV